MVEPLRAGAFATQDGRVVLVRRHDMQFTAFFVPTGEDGVNAGSGLIWLERNGFIVATPDPYSRQHKKFYEPTRRGVRQIAEFFPEDT